MADVVRVVAIGGQALFGICRGPTCMQPPRGRGMTIANSSVWPGFTSASGGPTNAGPSPVCNFRCL